MIFCTWNTKHIHFDVKSCFFLLRNIYISAENYILSRYFFKFIFKFIIREWNFQHLFFIIIIINILNYSRHNNIHIYKIYSKIISNNFTLVRTHKQHNTNSLSLEEEKNITIVHGYKYRSPHAREKIEKFSVPVHHRSISRRSTASSQR